MLQVIGKNQVAVPTHFFKVLLYETAPGSFELESFLLPNDVRAFIVSKVGYLPLKGFKLSFEF